MTAENILTMGGERDSQIAAQDSFRPAEIREADLLHAVMHVVRYGKLGKQSKRRLKDALRANTEGRTHG